MGWSQIVRLSSTAAGRFLGGHLLLLGHVCLFCGGFFLASSTGADLLFAGSAFCSAFGGAVVRCADVSAFAGCFWRGPFTTTTITDLPTTARPHHLLHLLC